VTLTKWEEKEIRDRNFAGYRRNVKKRNSGIGTTNVDSVLN
jgi:hypothetical protein